MIPDRLISGTMALLVLAWQAVGMQRVDAGNWRMRRVANGRNERGPGSAVILSKQRLSGWRLTTLHGRLSQGG